MTAPGHALHRTIDDDVCTLDTLGAAIEAGGRTPGERYAMLPPDLREHEVFRKYWADEPEDRVRRAVTKRMSFAATLELGSPPARAARWSSRRGDGARPRR